MKGKKYCTLGYSWIGQYMQQCMQRNRVKFKRALKREKEMTCRYMKQQQSQAQQTEL